MNPSRSVAKRRGWRLTPYPVISIHEPRKERQSMGARRLRRRLEGR